MDNLPTVTVRLDKLTGNDYRLVIRVENEPEIESQLFSRDDLQQVVGKFRATLGEICDIHQRGGLTPEQQFEDLHNSITKIRGFNTDLKNMLGEDTYDNIQKSLLKLIRVRDFKVENDRREKIPHNKVEEPAGRIVYEGNVRDFIPLDLLLINDPECNSSLRRLDHAMRYLAQVVSFSFLTTRNPLKQKELLSMDANADKGKVFLCFDNTLPYQDVDFFRDNSDIFVLAEEELQKYQKEDAAGKLIGKLVAYHSHFCHFNCHADTRSQDCREYHLACGEVKMKLTDLQNELKDRQHANAGHLLTFLNACGSAVVNPKDFLTFPGVFLEHFGPGGFIGTEHPILTRFASQFAKAFYANLFKDKEGSLEQALFKTRWFFAKHNVNLLGLFYTLYAAPGSRIRFPRTVNSIRFYDEEVSTEDFSKLHSPPCKYNYERQTNIRP